MDVTMMSIGTMRTPFGTTGEIPKGPRREARRRRHHRDRPAVRGRAPGHRGLLAPLRPLAFSSRRRLRPRRAPAERRPAARCLRHAVAASSEPDRPDGRATAAQGWSAPARARRRHARRHAGARHQAIPFERSRPRPETWLARGRGGAPAAAPSAADIALRSVWSDLRHTNALGDLPDAPWFFRDSRP